MADAASTSSSALPNAPAIARDGPSSSAAPPDSLNPMLSAGGTRSVSGISGSTLPQASRTQKLIQPGQSVPDLNAGDKIVFGLNNSVSSFAAVGWLAAAGYEQLENYSPNYGTDLDAFGQRLGASVVRDVSEGVFTDSVMTPLLREDPRYYRLGPAHNLFLRLAYAVTRPLVTRTDAGRTSPNVALLTGTLAGAALTNAYYPQLNRGPIQTFETYGGSIGGSAIGDFVREFFGDFALMFHPRHK